MLIFQSRSHVTMSMSSYLFDASTDKPLNIDLRGTYSKVEVEPLAVEKNISRRALASEVVISGLFCIWAFERVALYGYGAVFTLLVAALVQPVLRGHPSAPLTHLCLLYTVLVSSQFESNLHAINPIYHVALFLYVTVFSSIRRIVLCVFAALSTIVAMFVTQYANFDNIVYFVVHAVNDGVFAIVVCATCWKEKSE